MTKAATLILTGQIRITDRLTRTAETVDRLRSEGVLSKAILSCWAGEVDNYTGMRKTLQDAGFQIVEVPEPKKETVGNTWCQMVAYAAGLVHVTTPYVLKSRPDVFIAERVIRRLVSDIPRKPDRGLPSPFVDRVWVPWMVLTRPFYLADECFFAAIEDAWLLHNMDLNYDGWDVYGGLTHMRRFMHPFRHHEECCALLAHYADAGYKAGNHYERIGAWLNDPNYVRILSWYYATMRRCFDVYTQEGDIEFRPWSVPIVRAGVDVMPLATHFSGQIDEHCYDDSFIDAIADGVYNGELLGRMLSAGIKIYEKSVFRDGSYQKCA